MKRFKSIKLTFEPFNYLIPNLGLSYFLVLTSVGCGFLFSILILGFGDQAILGLYSVFFSVVSILKNLSTTRSDELVGHLFSKYSSSSARFSITEVFLFSLVLDVILMSVTIFVLWILVLFFSSNFSQAILSVLNWPAIFIYLLAGASRSPFIGILRAQKKINGIYMVGVIENFTKIIMLSSFYFVYGLIDFEIVALSVVLSAVFCSVVLITYSLLFSLAPRSDSALSISKLRRRIWIYLQRTFISFGSTTIKGLVDRFDVLFLSYVVSLENLGSYALAKQFCNPLAYVSQPFSAAAYPHFAVARDLYDRSDFDSFVRPLGYRVAVLSAGVCLFLTGALFFAVKLEGFLIHPSFWVDFALLLLGGFVASSLWWTRAWALSFYPPLLLRESLLYGSSLIALSSFGGLYFGSGGVAAGLCASVIITRIYWVGILRGTFFKNREV